LSRGEIAEAAEQARIIRTRMAENHKFTTVSIPTSLFRKLQEAIKNTGFPSVSSFVAFVMREIILGERKEEPFSTEDREKIIKRLKKLGYM